MNRTEMEYLLAGFLPKEASPFSEPSESDWTAIEEKFGCRFDEDFRLFISLMAIYQFPGDIFNVFTGATNGNDPMALVYDMEMQHGRWNADMIPFYGIGNGDYFCLNRKECPSSPVYYYYSEQNRFEPYSKSFDEWVRQLPQFMA